MLLTSIRRFGHALAALVLLLPVSLSADESSACHHWSSSIDNERTEDTKGAAFHPFFSIATARDVTRCVDAGANPNSRTIEGWTPLHLAAAFSDTATVIVALLDARSDLPARSELGDTPLHLAATNFSLEVTLTLLEAGAGVDAKNLERATPLHIAAALNKNEQIIRALLEGDLAKGAEVVRVLLEIRHGLSDGDIPKCTDQREKGCLAGAVLSDEQGERRKSCRLFLPKAAVVADRDAIHG